MPSVVSAAFGQINSASSTNGSKENEKWGKKFWKEKKGAQGKNSRGLLG